MSELINKITAMVTTELNMIWAAHHNAGLDGYMCLYTNAEQVPFRSKDAGLAYWFGKDDTKFAIDKILEHYNNGHLPNSPLLLNPVIHRKEEDGSFTPIGSGIIWCSTFILGIDMLSDLPAERLESIGAFSSPFMRGSNNKGGLKVIAFCDSPQKPAPCGKTVEGCNELYEITDIKSEQYARFYLLSGISYLTNNGLFEHQDITSLFPKGANPDEEFVRKSSIPSQSVFDAAKCWNAYERHHSLYRKFGNDVGNIENNLRFFNMVARDVALFDATGAARQDINEKFDFIIPGLIPRGAITLIAAAGGVGKSSIAHQLCVLAATEYPPGAEQPKWLGQPLDIEKCKGVSIYFSGEDGPQIFNARANMLDPEGLATRLMFQRTDFGKDVTFAQHMHNLRKIPDVPIVVIDPARKYLVGNENEASTVSDFFDALEEFAINKNSAVLVVHHLQKGAYPKSAREALDLLSGSQVFVDRPRVVIGMYRDGPYTVAGLAKNNIPPNLGMVAEERVFARDPKNLSLVWLPGKEGIRNAPLTEEEIAEIAAKARNQE